MRRLHHPLDTSSGGGCFDHSAKLAEVWIMSLSTAGMKGIEGGIFLSISLGDMDSRASMRSLEEVAVIPRVCRIGVYSESGTTLGKGVNRRGDPAMLTRFWNRGSGDWRSSSKVTTRVSSFSYTISCFERNTDLILRSQLRRSCFWGRHRSLRCFVGSI